jgi:mannitol-1-phosphate/altronate dehydrogenase
MKIEIEYQEVEYLKQQINELEEENDILKENLKRFDEKAIEDQSLQLAQTIFVKVMQKVFLELGFEYTNTNDIDFYKLRQWLGKNFYESDDIKVTFGATITNNFCEGLLRLGFKTKNK